MNLAKIRNKMAQNDIEVIMLVNRENSKAQMNIFYATGFNSTAGCVVISKDFAYFITDFRYQSAANNQITEYEVQIQQSGETMFHTVKRLLNAYDVTKVYVDSYTYYMDIVSIENICKFEILPLNNLLMECREVKSAAEIATIKQACAIGDEAFAYLLDNLSAGMTEKEAALILENKMMELGASGLSFATIVASGERGAFPHANPTNKVINRGELVTFDFGCYYNNYVSDMTRTIAIGEVNDELKTIYNVVLQAQKAGVAAVKAGITGKELDAVCRDVITKAGYGQYFAHSTGHGIGIDVHEGPSVYSLNEQPLVEGNVITIEPGIYIAGLGGVRIEDDVVVTKTGGEVLTKFNKEFLSI